MIGHPLPLSMKADYERLYAQCKSSASSMSASKQQVNAMHQAYGSKNGYTNMYGGSSMSSNLSYYSGGNGFGSGSGSKLGYNHQGQWQNQQYQFQDQSSSWYGIGYGSGYD